MARDFNVNQVLDYFDDRIESYQDKQAELRKFSQERHTERDNPDHQNGLNLMQDIFLMLMEDNILTTQIMLNASSYPSLQANAQTFRIFMDSQRFLLKIVYDQFDKYYL